MPSSMWEINEDEINKQMYKDFKKTEADLGNDIEILRAWVTIQPHLPKKPDDRLLRALILLNKFSIENAKQKLDMYYTVRSLIPEFFRAQPLIPELVLHSKMFYAIPLPKTTPDFKRIIYCQVNPNYGPEHFKHEQLVEHFVNVIELIIQCDKCYGIHLIVDVIGFKMGHIPKFSIMILKKAVTILEKVYSNRIASIYVVNYSPILDGLINNVIKPVLPSKLRNRLIIHSDTDILLKDFGYSVMPKDVGGDEKSLEELNDCQLQQFEEHKDKFEVLKTLRVDESLRPKKLVNDDILGYYGNFKKLNVD